MARDLSEPDDRGDDDDDDDDVVMTQEEIGIKCPYTQQVCSDIWNSWSTIMLHRTRLNRWWRSRSRTSCVVTITSERPFTSSSFARKELQSKHRSPFVYVVCLYFKLENPAFFLFRCPYAGCANKVPLNLTDMELNRSLQEYIRKQTKWEARSLNC